MAMALLALVMLSFASAQAIVMQTILSPSAETAANCPGSGDTGMAGSGAMSGMIMDGVHTPASHDRRPVTAQGHKTTCPYCDAAAHLPVVAQVALPQRIGIATFATFHIIAARGPRGPPELELRARGPPLDTLLA